MDLNTSEQNVTAGSVLTPGLVDLQKFMFSDRYHLTASALVRVCPWMTGLNLLQLLDDMSSVVTVECLPEGESHVL